MDRNIRTCKRCGAIYNSFGNDYCGKCAQELDDYLTKIQDYLFDHENAGVVEISEALEINGKIILDFIKSGDLVLEEGSSLVYCENCNKPISSGRYCKKCEEKLGNLFGGILASYKKDEPTTDKRKGARMHIRHKDE